MENRTRHLPAGAILTPSISPLRPTPTDPLDTLTAYLPPLALPHD